MSETVPKDIEHALIQACKLHQQAVSDYDKCKKFSELMSGLLAQLEDNKCFTTADKVMSILLDCNPKAGAHCDKSTIVNQATQKLELSCTPEK